MSFSPEEDRMLLRISTTDESEYHLWLTRRFIKVLWAALLKTMERDSQLQKTLLPGVRDAIMGMRHQEAIAASDLIHRNSTWALVVPDPCWSQEHASDGWFTMAGA